MNIPKSQTKAFLTIGIISVIKGEAHEEKLEAELKNLIDPNWKWNIRMMDRKEFLVVFPRKESLETFSRLSMVELALDSLVVKISKRNVDPSVTNVLQTAWIKIFGIPDFAKEELIKEITSLVAKPVVVDELSLLKEGSVRVKVNCRDPLKIRSNIEIFFNKMGKDITFVVETFGGKRQEDGPSKPDPKDQDDDEEGNDMDDLSSNEDNNPNRGYKGGSKSGQEVTSGRKCF